MKEIQLTQGKIALVDDEDFERVNQFKWFLLTSNLHDKLYAYSRVPGLMHRFIMSAPTGFDVDHIDNDGLNDQKSNLRICTRSQNMMGIEKIQRVGNRGKSKFKGVDF